MKIYTKTGDSGDTGLLGGKRVRKNDPRIDTIGAVDELNASLGVTLASGLPTELDAVLARVQAELFEVGAALAASATSDREARLGTAEIDGLESAIDDASATLPPLTSFILPGGSPAAAQLHLTRAVCRRAERCVVSLANDHPVSEHILIYLNRLSDLLFVFARATNLARGVEETKWMPGAQT